MNKNVYNNDKELLSEQYNKYPYPGPLNNLDKNILNQIPYADPNFNWHLLWPENKYRNNLNILIAGCGTRQAAILARLNPKNNFIGADISNESIKYQEKLKFKYKLDNLKLICEDFRLLKFEKKFDYIVSTGVIHHLEKPETGLEFFENNLTDDGVIYLMVYGDKERYSTNQLIKILKKIEFKQNNDSIENIKNLLQNLNSKHPAKKFVENSGDIKTDYGIVDLLLHNQEKHYDIIDLLNMINNNKLIIKNFVDGKICSLTKFFIYNNNLIDQIRKLNFESRLQMAQILNWHDSKIELILCKKKNIKNSLVYDKVNLDLCYFYYNRSNKYLIKNNCLIITELYTNKEFKFQLDNSINLDWEKILNGQIQFSEIISNKNINKDSIHNIFYFLFENRLIDISFHKIKNFFNDLPNDLKL